MPFSSDENRDWVLSQIPQGARVLDVGAGAGIFADLLVGRAEFVDAVEIFEPYVSQFGLRDKYREVFVGDFKELPFFNNSYDVVIMGDVLEHFAHNDAMQVWDKARKVAGRSGLIVMSTPIVYWPQGEENGNIHETHLSFFDMEDLKRLPGVLDSREGAQIGSVVAVGEAVEAEDLTMVITSIPTRKKSLDRALMSVANQTLQPGRVIVQMDTVGVGAPANRDAGLSRVSSKYVAFLDDDDYLYPQHIQRLYETAVREDADLVYSWFDVIGGSDPFPENFGKPWDPENPRQVTVTTLGKTQAYVDAGGYTCLDGMSDEELEEYGQGNTIGEDFRLVCNINAAGKKIVHHPEKTWAYVHWGGNTSGRPNLWGVEFEQ